MVKRGTIYKIIFIMILTVLFGTSTCLAYTAVDTWANGSSITAGSHASLVEKGPALLYPYSGVEYQIYLDDKAYVYQLDAGTTGVGNGAIQGYACTADSKTDVGDYVLSGGLGIELEDVKEFLNAIGNREAIDLIEKKQVEKIVVIAVLYINVGVVENGVTIEGPTRVPIYEAAKGYKSSDVNIEGTYSRRLYYPLRVGINYLVEDTNDYPIQESMYNGKKGWGGYEWKLEKIITPPSVTMDATDNNSPFVYAKIDDMKKFDVYVEDGTAMDGNTIPTGNELKIEGKSNLYGTVSGVQVVEQTVTDKFKGSVKFEVPVINSAGTGFTTRKDLEFAYNDHTVTGTVKWLQNGGVTFDSSGLDIPIQNDVFENGSVVFEINKRWWCRHEFC